jgi:hypothetical protein
VQSAAVNGDTSAVGVTRTTSFASESRNAWARAASSSLVVSRRCGVAPAGPACGKAITDTQEHEVEGEGVTPVALAHPDCYRVWREESRRMKMPRASPSYRNETTL